MATYRVSEFAKLAQVSVRLLHHYDRIGLLKPASIDPLTSYRRYELIQLHRLNRILALRDLGFSLTQIADMISHDISPEQVRTMYEQKSHELRVQIARDSLRLAQAELRLQYIEAEAQPTVPDIILKKIEPVPALVVRTQFYNVLEISALFARAHKALDAHHLLRKIDQRIGIYFDFGTIALPFAGELAFTLTEPTPRTFPIDDNLALHSEMLSSYDYAACTLQTGAVAAYGATLVALTKWIDINGWQVYGVRRDIYLQRGTPDQALTEIQIPIRRADRNSA